MSQFDRLLSSLPVSKDKMVGMGMQHFISEMEPDDVKFVVHPNGFSIQVKTSEEKVQAATEFWQNSIEQNMGD